MVALYLIGLTLICFLLGSIPWGVIISRLGYGKDIRDSGSGNIGTTNAMRTLGKKGGVAVFILDFGKGLLSGLLGWLCGLYLAPDVADLCLALAFLGCVFGHIYSPWLKFKGGKGIAVAIGALFFTFGPLGAAIELAVFIVLVPTTRYVSVGSLGSSIACPPLALWIFWGHPWAIAICTVTALAVIFAHRGNISRLRQGTERKIGSKKQTEAALEDEE